MVDTWRGDGMRTPWLLCWILLLTAANMSKTENPRQLATKATSLEARQPIKNPLNKTLSVHELLERHSGRTYPTPPKDTTTRLPEFVPDGPRPFIPDPIFKQGESEIVVRVGELAVLPCTVEHLGTRQVSWNKVGREHFLSIGTEIWVQDTNLDIAHYVLPAGISEWHLVFREARLEDSGLYDCQIISTEKLTWRVRLTVVDIPPHNPEISIEGKEFVESGQTVYLKCNTTEGDRIPEDLDWFKDGDKIEAKEYPNILITKFRFKDTMTLVSEMMISSGTGNDSGTYICRSTSGLIASIEINVLVADSSNVKRGTGTSHTQTGSGQNYGNAAIYYHFFGGKSQIFCVIMLAHFTIHNIIT